MPTNARVETARLAQRTVSVPVLNWKLFQSRLKAARERAEIKQVEIETQIGMNNSYYSDWERGEATPNVLDWLIRLSTLFDTTTDYLLGRTTYAEVPPRSRYRTVEATQVAEILDKLPAERRARVLAFAQSEFRLAEDTQVRDEKLADLLRQLIRMIDLVDAEASASAKSILAELVGFVGDDIGGVSA